jgi:hypothetical protein
VSYLQASHPEAKMDIVGHIEAAKSEYGLNEPISVTAFITNASSDTLHILVPRGRAGGIQIEVKQGDKAQVKDMLQEPEPGLETERKIAPGETFRQEFVISDWLILKQPGTHVVACTIPIEVSRETLRAGEANRSSKRVTIQSDIRFNVA